MSGEEATTSVESSSPASESVTEATSTENESGTSSKPAGYDPVDPATAKPEEVKDRLDYLYRQVKHSDRDKREMQNLLRDQSRVIDELSRNQQAVVSHLTEKSFVDSEESLTKAMNDAWKKGDERAYIDAQNRLLDVKVQKRTLELQPKQQSQPKENVPQSAVETANGALKGGIINEQEYRATESWQSERDDTGNLIRPWAFGTNQYHHVALREVAAVFENPKYENYSYDQKLAEVDRRMGTAKRNSSQSVIGGSLTKPGKSTKIELTPKQREIALKTNYAGKGKSEAENLEAYRKQVEKFQQRRAK